VVVVDSVDSKLLQILDTSSGRSLSKLTHSAEITNVALNQHNLGPQERLITFIDRNRDLFVASMNNAGAVIPTYKLTSHVESFMFNDETDVLVALADGRLNVIYQPAIAFFDKELLEMTISSSDASEFGRNAQLTSYTGNRISIRKMDGSLMYTSTPVDIPLLYELMRGDKWDESIRLCRHQKSNTLWSTLASMAMTKKQLEAAEIALAEIDEVPKVQYIQTIKAIPSEEGRQAEMALLRRQPDEAERILLQASPPLVYRAIKMNLNLYRWTRALELAVKHKTHVDTVMGYRQKYLDEFEKSENIARFQQLSSQVPIDWGSIRMKEEQEIEEERMRSGERTNNSRRK